MENLSLTTPSILFSAISLIMLAYTNRFLSYAQVVRNLQAENDKKPSQVTQRQLDNLRKRLYLSRSMQLFGIGSLLLCVCCTFFIFIGLGVTALYLFGIAMLLLVISLGISIREVLISVRALEVFLDGMKAGSPAANNRQRSTGRAQSSRPKMSYDTMDTFSDVISPSTANSDSGRTSRSRTPTKKTAGTSSETTPTASKSGGNRGRKPAAEEQSAATGENGNGTSGSHSAAQENSKPKSPSRSRSSKPRTPKKTGEGQPADNNRTPDRPSTEKQEE